MFGLEKLFRKKELEFPATTNEELVSFMEMMERGGIQLAMENNIKNMVDSSNNFQLYEDADGHGNYFGLEFNIRATAGRIKAAYTREPWIYATASLIARTLSTVPFKVIDVATNEPLPNHPMNRFLKMGNRLNDSKTLSWSGNTDLVLGGNFFRVFNETFTECMHVPVETASLKLAADGKDVEYLCVWDVNRGQVKKLIPWKQVVHHKYPNPYNPYYGLSLFVAASRPLILDRFKNEFEMALYLRGANNTGVVETTEDISKTRLSRLLNTFEQHFTGKRNWGRTIFLPKGAKWVSSGLAMSELQHLESLRENRRTILAIVGVPPSKVGIVEDVNRSTAEIQDKTFYENTIVPLGDFEAEGWNNSYLVKVIYGGRIRIEADYSKIESLQGSIITKGEQSKAMESYFYIDEIRAKVWGENPLPNGAGTRFVAEVRGSGNPLGALGLMLNGATPKQNEEVAQTVETEPTALPQPTEEEPKQIHTADAKTQAVSSQERLENKFTEDFSKGYGVYLSKLLGHVSDALKKGVDVEKYLKKKKEDLARAYVKGVETILLQALDRSFAFANSQSKTFSVMYVKAMGSQKRLRFNETDQQAIDALREEQRDGQRTILAERAIKNFVEINETRTKEVLDLISRELESGKTTDQIAASIREQYGEAYKNQASTVARTEILSAISQGIKWNHDVLGEVFTKVNKQWFHVGDVGSNPDARKEHQEFEDLGAVDSDYKFGGKLSYPRDPKGSASDNINCRCSMVSVVPDDAQSNAEVILDRLL